MLGKVPYLTRFSLIFAERSYHAAMEVVQRPKFGTDNTPFTVFIEGNIGSGKTTFLNHFQKFESSICLLTEPVEKWRDLNGNNLFNMFYKEPFRWAMPFQTYVTLTMLNRHTHVTDKAVKLMERSMFSARYCFVENMVHTGILHQGMYDVLQEWYKSLEKMVHIQADLIVYLRSSPEVVFERMRKRARSEESQVPLEYLQQLHDLHENWLIHGSFRRPAPVLVLDANLDLNDIGQEYQRSEKDILKPILTNSNRTPILASPSKRSKENF